MARAVVITGGNEGDRMAILSAAAEMVAERAGRIEARSSVWESKPWGDMEAGTGTFMNQVLVVETPLGPEELLDALLGIETDLGRRRTATAHRYASRTIDIDILFYDEAVIESERLTIPHPLIAERGFVLAPLAEVLPDMVHPVDGKTVRRMLEELDD